MIIMMIAGAVEDRLEVGGEGHIRKVRDGRRKEIEEVGRRTKEGSHL